MQVSDDVLREIEEQLSDTSENAFDVMAKYILITSNSTSRELTDYERMMQAIQLEELIPKIKGDENLKGRALRAEVAKEMNRSNGTIGKYRTIYNHLISEFMDKFKSGDIKVSMAESLAGLPKESQYRLLKISSLTMSDIEYEKRQIDQEKTVSESDTKKEAESRINTQYEGDFETVSESDTKKEAESRINTQCEGDFRAVSEYDTKKSHQIDTSEKMKTYCTTNTNDIVEALDFIFKMNSNEKLFEELIEIFRTKEINPCISAETIFHKHLPYEDECIKVSMNGGYQIEYKHTLEAYIIPVYYFWKGFEDYFNNQIKEEKTVSESDTKKEAESRINTQCEGDFRTVSESDTEKEAESRINTLYEDNFETENYPEKSICTEKSEKEYTKADIEEELSKYLSYKIKFKEEDKNTKYGRKILLMCDALQMLLDNFD